MNLNGAGVQHKKYGQGVIKEVQDNYILIEFNGEIKKFAYPNAFKLWLKPVVKDITHLLTTLPSFLTLK